MCPTSKAVDTSVLFNNVKVFDGNSDHLTATTSDCVEHVLPLFTEVHPSDARPGHAIAIAREWSNGNASVEQARQSAFGAHAAARESSNSAAIEVARAAGHAVATAHTADHELGAAAYAIRAVMKSVGTISALRVAEVRDKPVLSKEKS